MDWKLELVILPVSDVDRAKAFYTALFHWTAEDTPMPSFTYTHFKLDGYGVAGAYPIQPDLGNA